MVSNSVENRDSEGSITSNSEERTGFTADEPIVLSE